MDDRGASWIAGPRWGRMGLLAAFAVAIYLLGQFASDLVVDRLGLHLRGHNEPVLHRTIMAATVAYIILMAIPFAPGVEIGLGMLLILGPRICFLVYVSTVVALTLGYVAGRILPADVVAKALGALGLAKAQQFVNRVAALGPNERIEVLMREVSLPVVPKLVRHRFLALVVLLNLPGNIVIGGGGGIALICGLTRLFPLPLYLLIVAVAVAPVPLIVWLTG